MPISEAGVPEPPSDLGSMGRRLVRLERLIQMGASARSLVKAAIGRGGLLINKGGSITVADGGSVVIESGNLVLGEGLIEGKALKNQLEPRAFANTESGFWLGTDWSAKSSVTVTPPSWATSTIVQGFASTYLRAGGDNTKDYNSEMRVSIDGANSMTTVLAVDGFSATVASGSLSFARQVSGNSSFTVQTMLRARTMNIYNTDSRNVAAISAVVLFAR